MIADIFYPIFTLMITILACFIRKKKGKLFWGFAPSCSPRYCPGLHGGGGRGAYSSPQTPQLLNRFWLFQEPMRPYFFCLIP